MSQSPEPQRSYRPPVQSRTSPGQKHGQASWSAFRRGRTPPSGRLRIASHPRSSLMANCARRQRPRRRHRCAAWARSDGSALLTRTHLAARAARSVSSQVSVRPGKPTSQKSGLSACGRSIALPVWSRVLSAQTNSGQTPSGRRYVILADQGVVNTPGSSTVNSSSSPGPL